MDGHGIEMRIITDVVELLVVATPDGKGSTIPSDLPASSSAGKRRNEDLFPSPVAGAVGEPVAVGREAYESDFTQVGLGLHQQLRLGIAGSGSNPDRSPGWARLLDVDEVAAIGRPLWPGQSDRNPV